MWVKSSDDELLREPYISLTGNAYKCHHAALQMASRLNLNGRLSRSQVMQIANPKAIAELTTAAFTPSAELMSKLEEVEGWSPSISTLWTVDESCGVLIGDFFDYVLSPSERAEKSAAGRKGGQSKRISILQDGEALA